MPDLDQALSGARLDCGQDLHKQLIEFGGAAKVWMTVQVEYEPVNPLANKQPFGQYLSAAPTRMFRRDGKVSTFSNPYIDFLQILTDRIREFNVKFIRDKSGRRFDSHSFYFVNDKVRASWRKRLPASPRVLIKKEGNSKHSKQR